MHQDMLCGLLWGTPVCTWLHQEGDRERFDSLAASLEWADLGLYYSTFDLRNFSQGRNEVLCADQWKWRLLSDDSGRRAVED